LLYYLAKAELPGRSDVGALRLRTVATNDRPCRDFPLKTGDDYDPPCCSISTTGC
jgi:2-methylfumaryl-CoA hydratase